MLCVAPCLAAIFRIAAEDAREARDTFANPDIGTTDEPSAEGEDNPASVPDKSRPAARRRAPSLIAALAVGIMEVTEPEVEGDGFPEVLYARSIPRLTILSHFRLSWVSSASWVASCERNSRHLASFCAINCKRSACLLDSLPSVPRL